MEETVLRSKGRFLAACLLVIYLPIATIHLNSIEYRWVFYTVIGLVFSEQWISVLCSYWVQASTIVTNAA